MEEKFLSFKHRLIFSSVISLFFTVSLFIFGPLYLYVTSDEVMWFSFRSLLLPVAAVSLIVFLAVTVALTIPKGSLHKLLCCLMFGLSIGFYIQGGFFNISYGSGVLDGSEIVWRDYTTYGALDSAMWAACVALPFAFYMVFKKQWRHILMIAAAFIMVFQLSGLALTIYQNQDSLDNLTHEVSKKGVYELSEDDNTLVFVLSSMDQSYFDAYKKRNPGYQDSLQGFREYDNTLATGAGSIVSFPAMLTGKVYRKDIKYDNYIDNMWKSRNVFTFLDQQNVDARIYSDEIYFSDSAVGKIKNIVGRVQDFDSYQAITKSMYKYTLYNFMPHYAKRFFWMNTSSLRNYQGNATYNANNDAVFFSEFEKNDGWSFSENYASAVRIYYLKGAQYPYRLTAEGNNNIKGTSLEEQVEGDFNCLFEMLDDLKESGKYKNATIIITADNGDEEMSQNPVLLIKNKGRDKGYETSSAPMTLFDLPATLAATATNRYTSYGTGKTFNDAEKSARNQIRFFYLNAGSNADSRIEEYKCTGDADDADGMELTNSFYIFGGKVDNYVIGTELKFTTDETAAIYCTEGFGHTNGWRTILRGPAGQMRIPLDNLPEKAPDLHVYFNVMSVYENTHCVISANGRTVFDRTLDESIKRNGLNFRVPCSEITEDGVLTLDFSFPEISDSELELGTNERTAIMSFTSFKIYTQ